MTWNQRLGWLLFGIYAISYFAFVVANAFAPAWMEWQVLPGMNLALSWGAGLILFAFLLAALYGFAARAHPGESPGKR